MKKVKIKCPLESSEAKTLWEWAQYHPIAKDYLFAIPNGGTRNVREAINMRAQGVRPGVSDYFLAYPSNGKHGLWIELKRSNKTTSKLTEEQGIWLVRMEKIGYITLVAYGAEEAIKKIKDYLMPAKKCEYSSILDLW
jgi:hypothetical protein